MQLAIVAPLSERGVLQMPWRLGTKIPANATAVSSKPYCHFFFTLDFVRSLMLQHGQRIVSATRNVVHTEHHFWPTPYLKCVVTALALYLSQMSLQICAIISP